MCFVHVRICCFRILTESNGIPRDTTGLSGKAHKIGFRFLYQKGDFEIKVLLPLVMLASWALWAHGLFGLHGFHRLLGSHWAQWDPAFSLTWRKSLLQLLKFAFGPAHSGFHIC